MELNFCAGIVRRPWISQPPNSTVRHFLTRLRNHDKALPHDLKLDSTELRIQSLALLLSVVFVAKKPCGDENFNFLFLFFYE